MSHKVGGAVDIRGDDSVAFAAHSCRMARLLQRQMEVLNYGSA